MIGFVYYCGVHMPTFEVTEELIRKMETLDTLKVVVPRWCRKVMSDDVGLVRQEKGHRGLSSLPAKFQGTFWQLPTVTIGAFTRCLLQF